ncbi:hypothetical protein ACQSD2_04260 [Streptococcus infantarius]|uniref:hypothetical protein n=1 Tax=Streptococcus TaxID=1301 RepID=UPI00040B2C3E|nr:hypothetical protein [Streptococcus equinus]SCW50806.1 hypothetical protein SAMN02910449_1488 [Streptococcus equinus]
MGATSISVRHVEKFEIPEGKTNIEKANITIGSISTTGKTLTIERKKFIKFKGSYTKTIDDEILVYNSDADEYQQYDNYQKAFEFDIFYSASDKLLFLSTTTPIAKKFLKELKKINEIKIEYTSLKFDLKAISNMMPQTKGVSFNSTDAGVSSKSFSGDEVDVNDEAVEALENDEATKIIGTLDILGKSRTIMLTQSGTILSFTSLTDFSVQKEYPMLEFAIATLIKINMLS